MISKPRSQVAAPPSQQRHSPRYSWVARTRSPTCSRSRARMSVPSISGSSGSEALGARRDLVLELHQAVDDALEARRAARDVHVHRDDGVDALDGGVVVVEAP